MAQIDRQSGSSSNQLQQKPQGRSGGMMRRGYDPFFMSPREAMMNPFAMMRRMQEDMDRMFEEFGGMRGGSESGMWSPAIEVSERDGNYTVCAELPGMKPDDVKVEVMDDALVIQGERRSEHRQDEGGMHRTERSYGQFYRAIPLPEGTDAEQAKARFENGVLEVKVPLTNRGANRRQIPIEGAAASGSRGGTIQASSESGSAGAGASPVRSSGAGTSTGASSGSAGQPGASGTGTTASSGQTKQQQGSGRAA